MIWTFEALAAFEDQGLNLLDHRRALEADVSRGRVLEARLLAAGSEDVAQGVEIDLLAHVELDQDEHRALQHLVLYSGGDG